MPNPLQSLFDSQAQRRAPSVPAVIDRVSETAGVYYCTIVATGQQVRASVPTTGTTYQKRTPVMLTRPDDGTIARTSGWIISKFGPAADYGVSAASPTSTSISHAGLSLSYVSPGSIVLSAGGAAVLFDLYGTGLLNSSITSVAGITLTGTFVTDSRITISAAAGGGVTPGSYDVTVDAHTVLRGFITVI